MNSRARDRATSWARQVAIAAAVRVGYTGHYVGKQIGRDHSTIYYALDRVAENDNATKAVDKVVEHLSGD